MPSITVNSEEPIVVLKLSEYESLIETLDILSENPNILSKLEKARKEMEQGNLITANKFFKSIKR